MSYILDALKRSDQERNRGQIPDIQSQPYTSDRGPAKPIPGRRWPLLILLVIVAVGSVAFAYLQSGRTTPTAEAALPAKQPPVSAPAEPVMPPARTSQPESLKAATAGTKTEDDALLALRGVELEVAPVDGPATTKPQPESAVPPQQVQPVLVEPVSPGPEPVIQDKGETQIAVVAKPQAKVELDNPYGDTPHQRQLPLELQRELPEMNISVHIYADQPGSRMVRINNATYREGDLISRQLKLLEITPDGLILSYKNTRYWRRTN